MTRRALITLAAAALLTAGTSTAHAASDPVITNWADLGTGHAISVAYGATGLVHLGNHQSHAGHALRADFPMRVMDGGGNVCWQAGHWVQVHGDDPTVGAYTVSGC